MPDRGLYGQMYRTLSWIFTLLCSVTVGVATWNVYWGLAVLCGFVALRCVVAELLLSDAHDDGRGRGEDV